MTKPAAPTSAFTRRNHGSGHSYRLEGNKVPGVTTIIGAGLPKLGLIGWAGSAVAEYVVDRLELRDGRVDATALVEDIRRTAKYPIPAGLPRTKLAKELSFAPNRQRDAAAGKGGKVHDLAMALSLGEEVDVPDELVGYVDAYLDWRERWNPIDEVVEAPILNRTVFYAGTPDLIARLLDGALELCRVCGKADCRAVSLVDWKTGQSGIFGEVALQTVAYANAEAYIDEIGNEQAMPEIDHTLGVWLRPDRTHETYLLDSSPEVFRLFRYVYEVAKWLDGPKLFGIDGEEPPARMAKSDPIQPK